MPDQAFLLLYNGSSSEPPQMVPGTAPKDCLPFFERDLLRRQLRVCGDVLCRDHVGLGPHVHIPMAWFGRPERYRNENPAGAEKEGHSFREYRSHRGILVRWHMYDPNDRPPAVYLQKGQFFAPEQRSD